MLSAEATKVLVGEDVVKLLLSNVNADDVTDVFSGKDVVAILSVFLVADVS